jgi:hypothetical protein
MLCLLKHPWRLSAFFSRHTGNCGGTCPFDFDEMIYGKNIKVTLLKQLRNEIKFNGLDALKAQLALDKDQALLV